MSFAIIGGVVGVAGVALSAYSTFGGAGAQAGIAGQNSEIARANAALDRRAAEIQANNEIYGAKIDKLNAGLSLRGGQIDEANANLEKVQGDFVAAAQIGNFVTEGKTARIESAVGRRNARTLTSYARTIEASGRDRISRLREDGRRAMGIVRGSIAKSGVVSEGSPLIALGENAANIELAAQDVNFETRTQSRGARLEAQNELSNSRRSILQMRQSQRNARTVSGSVKFAHAAADFKIAGAKIEQQAAQYASDAADFRASQGRELLDIAVDRYNLDLKSAGIVRAGSEATARATALAGVGTVLSQGADLASDAGKLFPKSTNTSSLPSANTGGGD